jgi:hypothetical protein
MASLQLQLQPPEPFDFKSPDGWLKWKRRYEQYCAAAGLTAESQARQVSTLLYCLGEEANDVLSLTNATKDERKSYSAVVRFGFPGYSEQFRQSSLDSYTPH